MFDHHSFYGADEIFWFENDKSGISLVRPDGSKRSESMIHMGTAPDFCKSNDAIDGWKRAILLMEEFNIWDGTAFACTMDAAFCCVDKDNEAILFVTPQSLDRIPVKVLPWPKRKLVSENLAGYYSNSNLQAKTSELILHGMSFCFNGAALEPISMKEAIERVQYSDNCAVFSASYTSSIKALRKGISSHCNIKFPQTDVKDEKLYYIKRAWYEAVGENRDGKFVILKGSTINPNITGVMPKAAIDAREACIEHGVLGDNFELKETITLSSSSAAAAFVVGHTVSGPMTWRDEDGNTMKATI